MMNEEIRSIFLGTAGLSVAAVVALLLTLSRGVPTAGYWEARRVRRMAALCILLHCAHFAEEWYTAFYALFPEMLGLAPWSSGFFAAFNIIWIAIWILCIPILRSQPRIALFPLWFLAIASTANGVLHPLLAVVSRDYFAGLWSSPAVGVFGVFLLRALDSYTRPEAISCEPIGPHVRQKPSRDPLDQQNSANPPSV